MLPSLVPHQDAAHAAGRAALLVEALTRRPDLLLAATAALVARLRADGIPAVVSGAGPSVLAPCVEGALSSAAGLAGPDWAVRRLGLDLEGARASITSG
jgi:homoserine kinase